MLGHSAVVSRRLPFLFLGIAQSAHSMHEPSAESHSAETAIPAVTKSSSTFPNGLEWDVGEYKLKLGGFVKVDLIHDFNQIGSEDSFDTLTIPAVNDPSIPDDRTRLHARATRLNLDLSGPLHVFVEGDFFSDENGFRLRHAYGELDVPVGRLLAGQTWTTFLDDQAMPETLDYESPLAFPQIRQAQVRYRRDINESCYFAVSLEDPDNDVVTPVGTAGSAEEPVPDVNARLFMKHERGHVQFSVFGSLVRFDSPTASEEQAGLWGMNLSTKLLTTGKDSLLAQVTVGDGVGRYRGGNVAAIDSSGDLDAIGVVALMAAYQHHWSDEFRSNVVFGWAAADPPSGVPATTADRTDYLALNLIWQFHQRAWTGIEYLHGSVDTTGHDHGGAHRVQMSIRFDI